MPNTREKQKAKIVELMLDSEEKCECLTCGECSYFGKAYCLQQMKADHLIANGVTVQEWISIKDRLPEPEVEVMVLAERKIYSLTTKSKTTHYIMTTGMYEDGKKHTEDSNWWWEADGFEHDEERDDYIIPEGWWEYKHYNGDEQHNYAIDDTVTHWMPLPEPPKGE